MDTGMTQAYAQAIAQIDVLQRFTMDARDSVPVETICKIFGWRLPRQEPKKKLTKAKIVELFKNGKTPKEIANAAGVEEKAIRDVLKAVNLIDQGTTI